MRYTTGMTLEALITYSNQCRKQIHETLSEIEETDNTVLHRAFVTTSTFNTIAKLLAHMTGAEERWLLVRMQGNTVPTPYEDRAPTMRFDLEADADKLRKETVAFLATQTPETLTKVREIQLPGRTVLMTTEEVIFHVLNHESWHRGQIVSLLQQWGFDPPNFDYSVFAPTH
jgi:uncharacterized damage-inducible protein DinB